MPPSPRDWPSKEAIARGLRNLTPEERREIEGRLHHLVEELEDIAGEAATREPDAAAHLATAAKQLASARSWLALDDMENARQDAWSASGFAQRQLDQWHRYVEAGREDAAEVDVQRQFGCSCTLEEAISKERAVVEEQDALAREIESEMTYLLWPKMYPGKPLPEEREFFDVTDALWGEGWLELVDAFRDRGFGENAEILIAMRERLGLVRFCQMLLALRNEDASQLQRFCDLVTEQERRGSPDCYNRLFVRRGARGALWIVIDQPGNPDYIPPLVKASHSGPASHRHRQQSCARDRDSRGKATRTRGSRRAVSRAGGGSSGDDDPGGGDEPPSDGGRRLDRPLGPVPLLAGGRRQ